MRNKLYRIYVAVFYLGILSACSDVPDCADDLYTETAAEIAKESMFLYGETMGMMGMGMQFQIKNDIEELERDDDVLNAFSDAQDAAYNFPEEYVNIDNECRLEIFADEKNRWCRNEVCARREWDEEAKKRAYRDCPHILAWNLENVQPFLKRQKEAEAQVEELKVVARERRDEISAEVNERYNKRLEKAWRDAKFTISNIVTTLENEDVGSVECAADLVVDVEDRSAERRIVYTLETTSDGEVYVTLFQ